MLWCYAFLCGDVVALAALLVADEIMVKHAATKKNGKDVKEDRWKREVVLITHGRSPPTSSRSSHS